ncbi:MAG: response regulator [Deltaproteobacteria bacterium]|nr:response regulator [Deltaproteobacteria bacterium]
MSEVKRILVVDDSPTVRKLILKDLDEMLYEIMEAENGVEAMKMMADFKPHLVTLDVEMPQMGGYDTCAAIRDIKDNVVDGKRRICDTPVIFITANDTIEGRAKGFQSGGTEFVIKPFIKNEIRNAVDRLLRHEGQLQGVTALIIDDSRVVRRLVVNTLETEGVKSIEAENGVEAIKIIVKHENFIDFIITDYLMPVMDGMEFCNQVRNNLGMKDIPILFLTGSEDRSMILEFFKAGATDYLPKPFAKEELFARLNVHLNENKLKKELRERVIDLKRINKVKEEFLAIASHDLRSPLTGIIGFGELLLEVEYLQEDEREYVNYILKSGDFLLSMINDILDLGKIESESFEIELEPTDIVPILESCLHGAQYSAKMKDIRLECSNRFHEENIPLVQGDKSSLTRIFNNLLSNSIKFTPKKGLVDLTVTPSIDKKSILISITDTGIGIPPEKLPLIFDKYSKTSQKGTEGEKSTGLGMSITKQLVERHHGTITVQSKIDQGTSFIINFPII